MDYLPPIGLVAVIGGFWYWARRQERRLRAAVTEAASRLNGRYEPGGRFSGGTLATKLDGRDVVFAFDLSCSIHPERTHVGSTLSKPVSSPLTLKGKEAVARFPRLQSYSGALHPVHLQVESNLLTVRVAGVVREADKLVELAGIVVELCKEIEKE